MSFLQRFSKDASNACQDIYSNWVLGDDAGKSARLTLVLHPSHAVMRNSSRHATARIDLGMTFLEINGRAYVREVVRGSPAAKAGILPQDAVQFATVVKPEWMLHSFSSVSSNQRTEDEDDEDEMVQQGLVAVDPNDDEAVLRQASKYALEMEAKGMRTSYDDLRRLLAEAMDPTQSAFLSPPSSARQGPAAQNASRWSGPPIPSSVCVPMESNTQRPQSPFSGESPRPVVFVFRRTRQRKALHSLGFLPAFRLDDECDFATHLVKRLAPTADMEIPPPDSWEELVHDGTDWLLGRGSMLPPKTAVNQSDQYYSKAPSSQQQQDEEEDDPAIPLDDFERERARKLAKLRSRMAAEAMQVDRSDDVEAATIRGMIQKAVGLAFVRASKVVLGVSLHGGSGVVIARLSDGTWSAPSAIGTWGLGLGLQFGLEVAEYIFILQTNEALEHFRRGGSFTVGGNMGLAVAGLGREAYGAASVGGVCGGTNTIKDDEYDADSREEKEPVQSISVAPIVAYAKSQGLYVGVSLEGSRIFARDDINSRTYKFASGRDVSALDILSGKVPTPPEAEELYAALHSVEFTHEMSCLPRPPEVLRRDSANAWYYNSSTLRGKDDSQALDPFPFLSSLTQQESEECETFEAQFKNFMYGGVSVQRILHNVVSRSGRTGKERRTLWLMLPEVGSLRLGFVSKLSDGEGPVSNKSSTLRARREDPSRISGIEGDVGTVGSEELTIDSALNTRDGSTAGHVRTGNVQLSSKHSVALTDVTSVSQEPPVPVRFKGDDKMEHLRVISVQDVSGTSLLFLANNFREAELLVCGLKLLLERETTRLGVRGGTPLSAFGGRNKDGAMSPSAARGFRDRPSSESPTKRKNARGPQGSEGYSSDVADDSVSAMQESVDIDRPNENRHWGNVPGRSYMRGQAAIEENGQNEQGVPQYVHGQQIVRELAKNVRLPLPLPLCRVLLLDSSSPVIKKWERERGDKNFDKTRWAFPPATPRELERHASEHQLIASGSMCGAHRTASFDRHRYGSLVRLSETHTVDADDSKKVAFTVTERNPRRGFSIKVRISLRAYKESSCDASVLAEIRPVGKDMSNQAAVHKAFLLVIDEIKARYGSEGSGLLSGFLSVVDNMADDAKTPELSKSHVRPFPRTGPILEEKKTDTSISADKPSKKDSKKEAKKEANNESGLVSFEDMLKTGRQSPETIPVHRPSTPSLTQQIPEADQAKRIAARAPSIPESDTFNEHNEALPKFSAAKKDPVLVEVKPLPKIRLSLLPSPREADEDENSSQSPAPTKPIRKKKSPGSRHTTGSSIRKPSSRRKFPEPEL